MAAKTVAKKAAAKKSTPKAKPIDKKKFNEASILLKHASDPTRVTILSMLADGQRNVGDMAKDLSTSQPAISHHLALLRAGGIVAPDRQGKNNFYSLTDKGQTLHKAIATLLG